MIYELNNAQNIQKVASVYAIQNNPLNSRTNADTDESEFAKRLEKAKEKMKQGFSLGGKGKFLDEII